MKGRKLDVSVAVSWTTPKGGSVEGVRKTSLVDLFDDDLRLVLRSAADDAESSFRKMEALYDEDHDDA